MNRFGVRHPTRSNLVYGIECGADVIAAALDADSRPRAEQMCEIVGRLIERVADDDARVMLELAGIPFFEITQHPHD